MRLLQSKSLKSILTLLGGASLAQLIPLISSPLLTRLYTPEEFGMFGFFTSITIVLTGVLGGQYERASVLPKDNTAGLALLNLSFMLALVLSVILIVLSVLFGQELTVSFGKPEFGTWFWLVPLAAFASFSQRAGLCYSNRHYRFKRIGIGQVLQAAFTIAVQIVGGLFGLGLSALIAGFASGKAVAAIYLLKARNTAVFDRRYLLSKRRRIACVAKRYRKFPTVSATTVLLDNAGLQAAVVIAVTAYSFDQVGQFVLAQRVLALPLGMVSIAVGEVFFRKVVEAMREREKVTSILTGFAKWLLLVVLPAPLLLAVFGPELFTLIFGDEWRLAGEFSRILIVAYVCRFVVSPLSMMFSATAVLAPQAIFRILYFSVSFGVLGAASLYVSFSQFIYLFVVVELFMLTFYFVLALRVSVRIDSRGRAAATVA